MKEIDWKRKQSPWETSCLPFPDKAPFPSLVKNNYKNTYRAFPCKGEKTT